MVVVVVVVSNIRETKASHHLLRAPKEVLMASCSNPHCVRKPYANL